ncbi:MAG: hypothetical protein ACOY4K_06595 [Pseudomonadota bacterium]
MRHYVAVKDEHGRWFYANEGIHRDTGLPGWSASGACSKRTSCRTCDPYGFRGERIPSEGCVTCGGSGVVDREEPCAGHDTAEEAYEHQRQHLLDTQLQFWPDGDKPKTLYRCEVEGCETFTSGGMSCGSYRTKHVCADHRNREAVAPLVFVGESWES